MTLLNCLGSLLGLRVGSLDNTRGEVVNVSTCSVSKGLSQMNNALRLLPEGDFSFGPVLSKLTSIDMLQSFEMAGSSLFTVA